jgi:hypothetical protein
MKGTGERKEGEEARRKTKTSHPLSTAPPGIPMKELL